MGHICMYAYFLNTNTFIKAVSNAWRSVTGWSCVAGPLGCPITNQCKMHQLLRINHFDLPYPHKLTYLYTTDFYTLQKNKTKKKGGGGGWRKGGKKKIPSAWVARTKKKSHKLIENDNTWPNEGHMTKGQQARNSHLAKSVSEAGGKRKKTDRASEPATSGTGWKQRLSQTPIMHKMRRARKESPPHRSTTQKVDSAVLLYTNEADKKRSWVIYD